MAAGTHVRDLHTRVELEELSALFTRLWQSAYPVAPVPILRALSHAGGMVVGAFAGQRLIGGGVGFRGVAEPANLHSHIVGVDPAWQGHGVGVSIKQYQRQWCLDHGIGTMTWTFDPMVRRNASFNIGRLGAVGVEYHADYYGPMDDAHNAGVPTDRVLLRWELTGEPDTDQPTPRMHAALDVGHRDEPMYGTVGDADADVWLRVPATPPREHAQAWRYALREVMGTHLRDGYRWSHVVADGWYVLRSPETPIRERQ